MRKLMLNALVLAVAGVGCNSGGTSGDMGLVAGDQPGVAGAAGGPAQAAPPGGINAASPSGTVNTAGPTSGMATGAPGASTAAPGGSAAAPSATGTVPAAGAADAMTGAAATTASTGASGDLPAATGGPISEACRGFSFEGLVYSPGGDVLPNKCEAFHPTLNNPYAVRCSDAWDWWKTDFPGDNYCILPPPPDKGVQIGHHPQGEGNAWFDAVSKGDMSVYANPPAGWTLDPGGEEERNILIKHTNEGGQYFRVYSRMRGGSHHMIVSTSDATTGTFEWGPGGADGLFSGTGIPGAQRPDENAPQSVTIAPEDDGLYRTLPPNTTVQYNVHHFNSTDKKILKEAWQNLWWAENATTPINGIQGLPVLQAVGTFANPGEVVDMHYATTAPEKVRVLGLFGHRHAWTTTFTAWVERQASEGPEIVYQSFDWFDEPTYNYNSEIKNPMPDTATKTDGGFSGILNLEPGDQLHFNCHIEYTDERALSENSPVMPAQNGPLRFANQAYNAEMCILFGAAVGNNGTPEQLGAPPDFARIK